MGLHLWHQTNGLILFVDQNHLFFSHTVKIGPLGELPSSGGFKFLLKEPRGPKVSDISDEVIPENDLYGAIIEAGRSQFSDFPVIGDPYHHLFRDHEAEQTAERGIPSIGQSPDKLFVPHKVGR